MTASRITDSRGRQYHVFGSAEGGMGVVYFCRADHLADAVAVKVPRGLDTTQQQLFRREGLVWLSLGDRSGGSFLVHLRGVEEMGGMPSLLMPYYSRGSLRTCLRAGLANLNPWLVVTQIMVGMKELSDCGIVHRDLKPENVLVADDGSCHLTDFGIASAVSLDNRMLSGAGTLPYMAPEQLEGSASMDGSEDRWALGVMTCELLLGQHPFDASDQSDVIGRIRRGLTVEDARRMGAGPRALHQFIARSLAAMPRDRFSSLDEMAEAWDRLVTFLEEDDGRVEQGSRFYAPATEGMWRGLFFPQRRCPDTEEMRFKYTVLVAQRNAAAAYDLGEYRAALQHLASGFGEFLRLRGTLIDWADGSLGPERGFVRDGNMWTWHAAPAEVEEASQTALRTLAALLMDEPSAPEGKAAAEFAWAMIRSNVPNRHTKQLAAQILAYTGDHSGARQLLEELIRDDSSDPAPWGVLSVTELLAGAPPTRLADIARAAAEANLRGPIADYTQARLWYAAGDCERSAPYALKALREGDLTHTTAAEMVAVLWNGGATEEALGALHVLVGEAPQVPLVAQMATQLRARLEEWRRAHGLSPA